MQLIYEFKVNSGILDKLRSRCVNVKVGSQWKPALKG